MVMMICPHCSREFPGDKLNARHLAKCNPTTSPTVPPCLCGHEATSLTQMKRHRQDCQTWLGRDRGAVQGQRLAQTNMERYGVTSVALSQEFQERTKATNRERYGADNPFQRESSLFGKVQESLVGKRGAKGNANAFAKPEVKAKIRQHWQNKHGVDNPQQVHDIREATRATNLERYGGELRGSPVLRERVAQTNMGRYGFVEPSCNPEVKGRIQTTNMARYGVPWTAMDPEVRRKQIDAMEAKYGSHYFASDQGKAEVRAVLKERYGVEFPGAIEGHWDKVLVTFKQNYPDLAWPGMLARPLHGMNRFEKYLADAFPVLMFTGDKSFWRFLPLLGHHKNPDFIVPGPDPSNPKKGVTKVVEAFGDFWHSRMFTGKANFDHEQELIDAFKDIGIDCLVIWQSEVKSDPDAVKVRLQAFLEV